MVFAQNFCVFDFFFVPLHANLCAYMFGELCTKRV